MRVTRISPLIMVLIVAALPGLSACQADIPSNPKSSTSPSPADAPADDSSSPREAPYKDGYQPAWFEGSPWSCGMPADDVVTVSEEYTLDITGNVTDISAGEPSHSGDRYLPVILKGPSGKLWISPPTTVWTQHEIVVELPALADTAPVEAFGNKQLDSLLGTLSHCVPGGQAEGMTTYETDLPEGEYEVRAFVELISKRDTRQFVVSDPVKVAITDSGIIQQ